MSFRAAALTTFISKGHRKNGNNGAVTGSGMPSAGTTESDSTAKALRCQGFSPLWMFEDLQNKWQLY